MHPLYTVISIVYLSGLTCEGMCLGRYSFPTCEEEMKYVPMPPHPGLDAIVIDPGAQAELALGDLDFGVFAFFVLAAGAAGFGCLWRNISLVSERETGLKGSK